MTPAIARQCVLDANLRAEDLTAWADFDHPVEDSYGRRLVYDGGDFEIMVMSWAPGDFSAIHDHGEPNGEPCKVLVKLLIWSINSSKINCPPLLNCPFGLELSMPSISP